MLIISVEKATTVTDTAIQEYGEQLQGLDKNAETPEQSFFPGRM